MLRAIWGAEGSEPALCGPLAIPLVVAGEIDVLPPEWREVFEKLRVDGLAVAWKGLNGALYIDRVPECDCRCDAGQTACPVALLFEAAVPDPPKAAEKHCSCECIARLPFFEAGVNAAPEVDALQPGEDEQGSFDTPEFPQSHGKAILPRVPARWCSGVEARSPDREAFQPRWSQARCLCLFASQFQ
jgi:hypothetical protein